MKEWIKDNPTNLVECSSSLVVPTERPNLPEGWFKGADLIEPVTRQKSILIFDKDTNGDAKNFKVIREDHLSDLNDAWSMTK